MEEDHGWSPALTRRRPQRPRVQPRWCCGAVPHARRLRGLVVVATVLSGPSGALGLRGGAVDSRPRARGVARSPAKAPFNGSATFFKTPPGAWAWDELLGRRMIIFTGGPRRGPGRSSSSSSPPNGAAAPGAVESSLAAERGPVESDASSVLSRRRRRRRRGPAKHTDDEPHQSKPPSSPRAFDPPARVRAITTAFDALVERWWPDELWPVPREDRAKLGPTVRFYARVVVVAFLIRWFVVEPRYIPSASMLPTFEIGDQLAIEKLSTLVRTPRPTEVVLFRPPREALDRLEAARRAVSLSRGGLSPVSTPSSDATLATTPAAPPKKELAVPEVYIKRVVAGPGDTVRVEAETGDVYVNGVRLDEPFVGDKARYDFGPATVPEGYLFVLGDNRNRSFDSHVWGFLPRENVVGHAILRYWPLGRFGLVEH